MPEKRPPTRVVSTGLSMFPSVFPGARLEVSPVEKRQVKVGDILCFPGEGDTIIAHRVLSMTGEPSDPTFYVRGDGQGGVQPEAVSGDSAAFVVDRVEQRYFSYDTVGGLGRAFSYLVTKRSLLWRSISRLSFGGRRILLLLRAGDRFGG